MNIEYVEFKIDNQEKFVRLARVFDAIRAAKESGDYKSREFWISLFDAEALSHFWWPSPEDLAARKKLWDSTPVKVRLAPDFPLPPWQLHALIRAFEVGDYEIGECVRISVTVARLQFSPYGWPYGTSEPFEVLVESFGFEVINVSDAL